MNDDATGQDRSNRTTRPGQTDDVERANSPTTVDRPMRRMAADDRRPWLGIALGLAILAAPFLALLYGIEAGLLVMTLALSAVGLLAVLSARAAEPDLRHRLVLVAAANGVLAVVCLIVLLVRG